MLLTLILVLSGIAGPCDQATPPEQTAACHVPGTPPPAPNRERDVPPIIKDKPLPPV